MRHTASLVERMVEHQITASGEAVKKRLAIAVLTGHRISGYFEV